MQKKNYTNRREIFKSHKSFDYFKEKYIIHTKDINYKDNYLLHFNLYDNTPTNYSKQDLISSITTFCCSVVIFISVGKHIPLSKISLDISESKQI